MTDCESPKDPDPKKIEEGTTLKILSDGGIPPYYPNPYQYVTIQNGILKFVDNTHFNLVIQQLENDYETWNNNFETQWGHLSDDAFNDKVEQLGFDEDKTLKDFENRFYGFKSLRAKIDLEEQNWLNSGMVGSSPEYNYEEDDEFRRATLNEQGQLLIGNSSYGSSTTKSDETYTLKNGCDTGKRTNVPPIEYDNGNKRYLPFIAIRKVFWWGEIRAKLKSYQKKSNGSWRKYRTRLKVSSSGVHRDFAYCNIKSFQIPTKDKKKRWKVGVRLKVGINDAYTRQSEIGSYNFINGIEKIQWLYW